MKRGSKKTAGGSTRIKTPKTTTKKGGAMKKGGKVRPLVRKVLKKALETAVPLAVTAVAPGLAPMTAPIVSAITNSVSDKAINALGNKVGFGTRGGALRSGSDYSQFQHTRSPAMNPVLPLPDFSRPDFKHSGAKVGGSFKSAGY
jgi:hypothetical protein